MDPTIRRMRPDDFPEFGRCFSAAMGMDFSEVHQDRVRRIVELDGSFVAEADGRVVGTVAAYLFDLTTPGGGRLPTVGTTLVGVLPTHRRRGILRRLMRAHIDWAREIRRPLVALWASETPIYRHYDFGPVTERGEWTVDRRRAGWAGAEASDAIELVDRDDALPRLRRLYDRHFTDRAGALSRSEAWWEVRRMYDAPDFRNGASAYQFVIATRDGEDRGYLQYRRKSEWVRGHARDRILVFELVGDDLAQRSLWRYLLSMDLVETIAIQNRPVDDALPELLADSRQAELHPDDGLWLHLLDVPAVLAGRRYAVEDELVLDIDRVDGRSERWALATRDGRGVCLPTDREADVRLSAGTLASLAWGGGRTVALRQAGRIEGTDDAMLRLGRQLWTDRAPWCPEVF